MQNAIYCKRNNTFSQLPLEREKGYYYSERRILVLALVQKQLSILYDGGDKWWEPFILQKLKIIFSYIKFILPLVKRIVGDVIGVCIKIDPLYVWLKIV